MCDEDANMDAAYDAKIQAALAKHYSERSIEEERLLDRYFAEQEERQRAFRAARDAED